MATMLECRIRSDRRIRENTNELQREALIGLLDPKYGHSYRFSERGMHIIQRGRKYTITPFGAVHHGV